MAKAKCFRCGGTADGDTFEQAAKIIDHAVGLARGKPCGSSYNAVKDVTPKSFVTNKTKTKDVSTTTKPKTTATKKKSSSTIPVKTTNDAKTTTTTSDDDFTTSTLTK